jgi:membrane carboxypeptidase/penicillin-binding protein PbpC
MKRKIAITTSCIVLFSILTLLWNLNRSLLDQYASLESTIMKDRHGEIIHISQNSKGNYAQYLDDLPPRFKELLRQKEDRFFYLHLGVNPLSVVRASARLIRKGTMGGSSTITEQLAKNLLGNEQHRSISNKLKEYAYTISLEIFLTKPQILLMYANTAYLGNQIQGFAEGSEVYFGKKLETLNDSELIVLLATLSSPSSQNPWRKENLQAARALASRLDVPFSEDAVMITKNNYVHTSETYFELKSFSTPCSKTCLTTIDMPLTEKLREILRRNVDKGDEYGLRNGAIAVIKVPENELIALVGSPNTTNNSNGNLINMALEPRPIGSTAKPFIYLKGFEKGLRPYTLVDDREYKYPIATGFPLYPKNYDGTYRGLVTLHESLSNSLNVPAVKTLEYVGLPEFYDFLERDLSFMPLRELESYQFGIALGGLEMDPLTLAHYLSIFPQNGILKPLKLYTRSDNEHYVHTPMSAHASEKKIASPEHVELVTRVLNDRKTGVEQFGLKSNLNLSQSNYAVKTGTSRDYHDSWTIGYTPDFVVVVWAGNAENEPLRHVTGQSGAGKIWNESMELLFNSEYNKRTPFSFSKTKGVYMGNSIDFGLPEDNMEDHRNLLEDGKLIITPHEGDTLRFEGNMVVPLTSRKNLEWYDKGRLLGSGNLVEFRPFRPGTYSIKAYDSQHRSETVTFTVQP